MSESWTPGPWGISTRRGSWDWVVYVEADPNIEICQPFHDGTDDNEIGEANARLISAAPDLYAALQNLLDHYRDLVSSGDCGSWDAEEELEVQAARAALAKARGEQP